MLMFPSLTPTYSSDHQNVAGRGFGEGNTKKEEARPALGKPVSVSESARKNLTISIFEKFL
jgi:hypothetical protein